MTLRARSGTPTAPQSARPIPGSSWASSCTWLSEVMNEEESHLAILFPEFSRVWSPLDLKWGERKGEWRLRVRVHFLSRVRTVRVAVNGPSRWTFQFLWEFSICVQIYCSELEPFMSLFKVIHIFDRHCTLQESTQAACARDLVLLRSWLCFLSVS